MSRLDELSQEAVERLFGNRENGLPNDDKIIADVFRPYVEALEAELSAEKAENAELAERLDELAESGYSTWDACVVKTREALARRKARMEGKP